MLSIVRRLWRSLWRFTRRHYRLLIMWGITCGFVLSGLLLLWAATLQIPDLGSLESSKVEQSVKIYDRTGSVLLYDLHNEKQRTIVPLEQIAPVIYEAILAIEDPSFYDHIGIEPKAILRAVISQVTGGIVLARSGGSTLTQQVVKGSLLVNDQTIARKLKEWILAIKMERVFNKDQILELYLNQAPFGGQLYGVQEASQTFFGKAASDISLPEAAYLAAVLPRPTYYSPYGSHKDALDERKNLVLQKMYEHGYISAEERDAAKQADVAFVPPRDSSISAPHFVFFVRQYLEEKYGADAVEESGWRVTTTLDAELQIKAEEVVYAGAIKNTKDFNASNAALVAIDPKTGHILSMVGSRDYFDTEIDGAYNVAAAHPGRQPGSAFKPFAYAQAFMEGYTPETVLFDLPTQFSTSCSPEDNYNNTYPCYAPKNYDNQFRGPMILRNALAQSINIPAVKVLYLAGLSKTLELAKSMGITTLTSSGRYGLTLVLGGGEVTLLDMTSAYGVFAQNGVRHEPTSILRIEDAQGNVIEKNEKPAGTQVLPHYVAEQINDVLSDTVARIPLGTGNLFSFGRDVAVKTGTTNEYKDAWTIGYTPNLVIGMWAGNNDNTSMEKRVSGLIVGPMWSQMMHYALTKTPVESFSRRDTPGVASKPILRGIWQGNETKERNNIEYVEQSVHSILHWVTKSNPAGAVPANPASDAQYRFWEYPVRIWAAQNNYQDGDEVPVGLAPVQNQSNSPSEDEPAG